jgi:phosphoheptose isomerase
MTLDRPIFHFFERLIEGTMTVGDAFAPQLAQAAEMLTEALLDGKTIYTFGQGSSALTGQFFSHILTTGSQIPRPGFPSININQLTQNIDAHDRTAQALFTHAKQSDILVLLSRGGSHSDLIDSIEAAVERGVRIVLLAYKNDSILIDSLGYGDLPIDMSEFELAALDTLQFQVIACLGDLIDHIILGEN